MPVAARCSGLRDWVQSHWPEQRSLSKNIAAFSRLAVTVGVTRHTVLINDAIAVIVDMISADLIGAAGRRLRALAATDRTCRIGDVKAHRSRDRRRLSNLVHAVGIRHAVL